MDRDRAELLTEFDATARAYDRLTGANPGYHRHLALSARRLGLPDGGRGLRLLDAGCGTGASTRALLAVAPDAEIVAFDGSAAMLSVARRQHWPRTVRFVHSTLEGLSEAGVRGPFDGVLAAYLVRNLDDVDAGLAMLRDLLRPGAPIAVHEYSVGTARSRLVWNAVCWTIIIPFGAAVTGRPRLYRYLRRSVLEFDRPETLRRRLRSAGLVDVRTGSVGGWQRDIVHSFLARRATTS